MVLVYPGLDPFLFRGLTLAVSPHLLVAPCGYLKFLVLGYFYLIGAIALIFLLKVRHVVSVLLSAALL